MLWNLAIRTLLYDRGKLIAGLVGVIFSVVLVNIQGGLFSGLIGKASLLVDRSGADIWVGHRGMHNVDFPHSIPTRWIHRVRSVAGVQEAEPMRILFSEITLPDGEFESVVVVGVAEGSDLGRAFKIVEGPNDALDYPDSVIVDQCDDEKLKYPSIGDLREVGGRKIRIAGKCNGVLSFLVAPYIFTSHKHSAELTGSDPSMTSYFLIKLEEGVDKDAVCREIRRRLRDVTVMPTNDYSATSVNFWMTRTGIGLSFGAATLMGLLVGLVMVGQTLYAMVLDRIGEFATLKAIGSTEKEIIMLLTAQSTVVAVVGITIGTLISMLIRFFLSTPRTEINISIWLYVASATLVFVICLIASALPYLRVRRVLSSFRSAGVNVIPPSEDVGGFAGTDFNPSLPVFAPKTMPVLTPVRRESAPPLILEIEEVQKSYSIGGENRKVLDNVSFQVCSGESVFLSGPSGSGKSTLLSIMGCLLESDSGRVKIDGQRVDQLSVAARTQIRRDSIGFVFQRFQLIQAISAEDNVALPLTLQGVTLPRARERASNLLNRVGLESHRRQLPNAMSPGQCQRVALARAIITKPKLILADEPTAALDGKSGMEVMDLLQELISETDAATVVVTHDPRILKYADRVCEIENGRFK